MRRTDDAEYLDFGGVLKRALLIMDYVWLFAAMGVASGVGKNFAFSFGL